MGIIPQNLGEQASRSKQPGRTMKKQFHVVLTGGNLQATEYMVRTMDINQISEAIRDGFRVEPQGYEGQKILDEFKKAIEDCLETDKTELDLALSWDEELSDHLYLLYQQAEESGSSSAETYWEEYKESLPIDESDYSVTCLKAQIKWAESILKWVEDNKDFNICSTIPESEKATKEYKALDQMSDIFLKNLDNAERDALWQALQVEIDKVRINMRGLETLREYLEYGEIL